MKSIIATWLTSPSMRKALKGLRMLGSVALCLTAWGFAQNDLEQAPTAAVRILWKDVHGLHMLKESDIHSLLGPVQGKSKVEIFLKEQALQKLPYLADAQLCYGADNYLNVILNHREPILRVLPERTSGYYLAVDGVGLPLKPDFATSVPLLIGMIPQRAPLANQPYIRGVSLALKAREWITRDTLLEPIITQYVVAGEDSNALILRTVTGQEIWVGTSMDLTHKLFKLSSFYRLVPVDSSPESFHHINLVFKNQIVCR